MRDIREALNPMINAVEQEAGFWLPPNTQIYFNQIRQALLRQLAPNVCMLPPEWYCKLERNIMETETGLTASYYHMENILRLEERILRVAHAHLPDKSSLPHAGGSVGPNTAKTDFEYHAFVLAVQRTLEYFALSVEAFFQIHKKAGVGSRIKPLGRTIKNAAPTEIRDHVLQRLDKARTNVPDFIDHDLTTISNRDLISHVKNIEPAYLHVLWNEAGWQIRLKGGALSDRIVEDTTVHPSSLTAVLWDDLNAVEKLILGTYWDFGLLNFPRTGGKSINADLAQI